MQIFISYSSKPHDRVKRIADDIHELGHTVWYDQELTGGPEWWAEILHQIRQCDVFIFAFDENSAYSHTCRLETEYALALNKTIVTIQLNDTRTSLLPAALQKFQIVTYSRRSAKSGIKISRTLQTLPASKPLPDPLPAEPAMPLSPLAYLRDQINKSGELSGEEQKAIVNQLRDLIQTDTEEVAELVGLLLERADLRGTVQRDIQAMMATKSTRKSNTENSDSVGGTAVVLPGEPLADYFGERVKFLEAELAGGNAKAEIESELTQIRSASVQRLAQEIDQYLEQGQWSELIASIDELQKHSTLEFPLLYFNRAFAQDEQGNYEAALEDYTKALALDPQSIFSLINRGNVYDDIGETQKALTDYNKALEVDPQQAFALNNRGLAYWHGGEVDKALTDYNKAIEIDPQLAFAFNNRGLAYWDRGELGKALADFNKALELDASHVAHYLSRGRLHYEMGQAEKALPDFEAAARLQADDPITHNNYAFVAVQLGRFEQAAAAWEIATGLPDAPDYAFAGYAVALQKLGKSEQARTQYQTAIEMDARWLNDVRTIAQEYVWTGEMITLARDIIKELKRK